MRILLGTGTTDANGNVTVTYTGSGAGKVQLMAECGDIQSEQYTLYDVIFKDIGTDDTQTNYFNTSNYITITYDDNGKTFSNDTSSARSIYPVKIGVTPSSSSIYCFDCDFIVEFDLVDFSTATSFQISDGTNQFFKTFRLLDCTGGEHVRYEIRSNSQKIFVDGVEKYSEEYSYATALNARFVLNASNYVKIKNFIIYPI